MKIYPIAYSSAQLFVWKTDIIEREQGTAQMEQKATIIHPLPSTVDTQVHIHFLYTHIHGEGWSTK